MIKTSAMRTLSRIGRLRRLVEELAYVPRRTAIIAAPKLSRAILAQFKTGTDPYGRQWKALRPATLAKGRRSPPLTDSKRLRDGTVVRVAAGNRAGLRIHLGAPYGYFHQVGFVNARTSRPVAARRILPQHGMPAAWRDVIEQGARAAVRQLRRAG